VLDAQTTVQDGKSWLDEDIAAPPAQEEDESSEEDE
jgi:hypothetical protein